MLGVEKKVDAMRQLQGDERVEPQGPGRSAANTAIMLALVAIVAAVGAYFLIDNRYSARMTSYEKRLTAMDARVAAAEAAPREMALKVIAVNTLDEIASKTDVLKTQLGPDYQERLARLEELAKSIRADVAK